MGIGRASRLSAMVVFWAMAVCGAGAQSSPEELASAISERWSAGSKAEFETLFPFGEGRKIFSESPQRLRGLGSVIGRNSEEAVILLSGVPSLPNSGDATVGGIGFSGVYRARSVRSGWKLDASIPLDDLGRLLAHQMRVNIRPGAGLFVEDRMRVVVKEATSFAVLLNYAAKLESVRSADRDLHYLFGGGLLWADLPPGESEFAIRYSLDVSADPKETNSGCFLQTSGHVRNQFIWHPLFGFDATGDWATFDVEVRIPAEYRLSTGLPQSEQVEGGERVVRGRTPQRAFALSLVYDRNWAVERRRCGTVDVDILMLPGTKPDGAAVAAEFCSVYGLLSRRFGSPAGNHFGAVQARSWQDNPGWRFTSNTIVAAAATPGFLSPPEPDSQSPAGP